MTHVATLVADPATAGLDDRRVVAVAATLPGAAEPIWLAPGVAVDIPFAPPAGTDNARWAEAARGALEGRPFDVVVQEVDGRRKNLLITDMDSTMIEQECIDELADAVGLRDEVSAITDRSMRGELDFEQSLKERVGLLRGLDVSQAMRMVTDRITLMPGARALVQTMRVNGAITVLASGGFRLFTGHVAEIAGFHRHFANTLEVEGGCLTGRLHEPIFGRESKRETLRALRDELGLAASDTMAAGDGANDLSMLEEAGLGVAYRAKPAVAAVARARIDHGDLTALLYVQGYRQADFVV